MGSGVSTQTVEIQSLSPEELGPIEKWKHMSSDQRAEVDPFWYRKTQEHLDELLQEAQKLWEHDPEKYREKELEHLADVEKERHDLIELNKRLDEAHAKALGQGGSSENLAQAQRQLNEHERLSEELSGMLDQETAEKRVQETKEKLKANELASAQYEFEKALMSRTVDDMVRDLQPAFLTKPY